MTSWRVGPIGQDWVDAYAAASGDDNPIHKGRDAIVHGALILALMERFAVENAGAQHVAQLEARFLKPVLVGSRIVFALGAGRPLENGGQQRRVTAKDEAGNLCLMGELVLA